MLSQWQWFGFIASWWAFFAYPHCLWLGRAFQEEAFLKDRRDTSPGQLFRIGFVYFYAAGSKVRVGLLWEEFETRLTSPALTKNNCTLVVVFKYIFVLFKKTMQCKVMILFGWPSLDFSPLNSRDLPILSRFGNKSWFAEVSRRIEWAIRERPVKDKVKHTCFIVSQY